MLGLTLAVTLAVSGSAWAQSGSRDELNALRPTGPVTLTADRAEWVQGGTAQYSGNVSLSSENLQLRGSSMTVIQGAGNNFEAHITGSPARLNHRGTAGAEGLTAQPVSAQAQQIDYDSRTGVVRLTGGAELTRGGDQINGEQIDYIVAQRRIRASGGDSGQVRIVIQPPEHDVAPEAETPPIPSPDTTPPASDDRGETP
ncbi:lipopolysaccharide transport periplasmic protein LptA [Sinimarinibacterium sp. CAU 1509]|uniref:lipopolysaccharide transport periplasmic protein LptA n=1 Tax=Sinimarinibacterium sp. CAU 1509 TaxID=2562283 RepID=UPI001469E13D|nr:lipopolysaccharide transport periplasmic protein LptA [Sinimarinibacterium sp. CAU 1509]